MKNVSKKYLITAFRILLVFISLELALRIVEFGYYFFNEMSARIEKKIDQDAFRIICIGESTVDGYPVKKTEFTFPYLLEQRLKAEYGDNIQVFNLGITGITLFDISEQLVRNLAYYKPDLVIVYAGHNIEFLWHGRLRIMYGAPKRDTMAKIVFKLKRAKVFKLYGYFKILFDRDIWIKKNLSADHTKFKFEQQFYAESYEKEIGYMIENCRKAGAEIILCSYFDSWVNELLLSIAEKNNIAFCDIYAYGQKLNKAEYIELLSADSFHPSKKGYNVIAEQLFAVIKDKKLMLRSQ